MYNIIISFCKPLRKLLTLKENYKIRVKDLENHLEKYRDNIPPCCPSCNVVFEGDTQEQVMRWVEEDLLKE